MSYLQDILVPEAYTEDGTQGSRSNGEILVDRQWFRLNSRVRDSRKRWSLRPYKANVHTTCDFRDGGLDGLSIGGGVRWESKNIIGGDDDGTEWKGVDVFQTDFMLRYRHRLGRRKARSLIRSISTMYSTTSPSFRNVSPLIRTRWCQMAVAGLLTLDLTCRSPAPFGSALLIPSDLRLAGYTFRRLAPSCSVLEQAAYFPITTY